MIHSYIFILRCVVFNDDYTTSDHLSVDTTDTTDTTDRRLPVVHRPETSSVLGTRNLSFYPQHPDANKPTNTHTPTHTQRHTLPSPQLIIHTRAVRQQAGKLLRMQKRRAAHTQVRVRKNEERKRGRRVCVCCMCCVCVWCPHRCLWISTTAL